MVAAGLDFSGAHVHLMGVAGAGMSALVPLLQQAGAQVSGCDLAAVPATHHLHGCGVSIALGHDAGHLSGVQILVHSSAVDQRNPELQAAREADITVLSRQACLAELLRGRRTLAVAGSHGKTSTAWMIGHLLLAQGRDPVVLVGGAVAHLGGGGAHVGAGDVVVVEVDESDGGFAHTSPEIAVLTNLEPEHLDHYGSEEALYQAFAHWLQLLPAHGTVIVPDQGLPAGLLNQVQAQRRAVGLSAGSVRAHDLHCQPEGSQCRVHIDGVDCGSLDVPIPGTHMVHNALMAVAAVHALCGEVSCAAMASSGRVGRRFTDHGRYRGVRVIEDYAHHPTEIRATLAAAALAGGRLQVLFQPHRFTRTRDLLPSFATAFAAAHALAVVPTYAASEAPVPGGDAATLASAVMQTARDPARIQFVHQWATAIAFICAHARYGDTVLILGAGDIGECVPDVVHELQSTEAL